MEARQGPLVIAQNGWQSTSLPKKGSVNLIYSNGTSPVSIGKYMYNWFLLGVFRCICYFLVLDLFVSTRVCWGVCMIQFDYFAHVFF